MRTVIIFIGLLVYGCSSQQGKSVYVKIAGYTQGTTYHITYQNTINRDLTNEVETRLKQIDEHFSTYNPSSLISRINKNDSTVTLTPLFIKLLSKSQQIYQETNGAFDITVAPLVNAWGFGKDNARKPSSKTIDSLLQIIGMHKIRYDNHKIYKSDSRIQLDVNAIAQGFTVDYLVSFFDSLQIPNYLIEIGGELYAKGNNPQGKPWRIGIERPVDDTIAEKKEIQKVVEIKNAAVSTSGNYRKFYIENGIKYSHTINPFNGYPAKNTLLSVTIIASNCTDADAYATACMVMGLEKSIELINHHPELKAYFIYSDTSGKLLEYFSRNF